jgi:hypothetical protein
MSKDYPSNYPDNMSKLCLITCLSWYELMNYDTKRENFV